VTTAAAETGVLRQAFERVAAARQEPSWLEARRREAMERFLEQGYPTPRDEAWRHTPIQPIVRERWQPAVGESTTPVARALVPGGFAGTEVVIVGGRVARELSHLGSRQEGIAVLALADAVRDHGPRLEAHLARLAEGGAFTDLNTALGVDGVVVLVDPDVVVGEPIHVAHVAAPGGAAVVSSPRVLVVAGRGSECRIVETYVGPSGGGHLTLAVSEIEVGDNARVEHYRLQGEDARSFHVGALCARLGRDSRFASRNFAFGAAISRLDVDVRFSGEGGEASLDGLFVADGDRLCDTHTRIDHAHAHCSSRERYKGILDGKARGVFHGVVVVRPGAQKTDAQQMNRNLLLSREALVHSIPQLEILADDVKCRHGSTTGQLDANALFYLRSRGLGEAEARSLLTWAFASDLVEDVEVASLREALAARVATFLPGADVVREAAS